MSKGLDMSLDDIIKSNKSSGSGISRGGGRGRGRGGVGSGPVPARRFPNRAFNRPVPYGIARAPPFMTLPHGMFADQGAGHSSASETETKLYISNLEYGVSNEDIKELFAEVGDLRRYSIHYDKSGRSKGTAEVIYSRRAEALAAMRRYDNVQLDGKPMKIEIVGTNFSAPGAPVMHMPMPMPMPMPVPVVINGSFGNSNGAPRGPGRGGAFNRLHGSRGGGGRGFGRGRGGERRGGRGGEKVSADDLDADLAKYHSEAMQTN